MRRIAVVRPNHRLGNTLLLTPLVGELEARFPGARIDVITACSDAPAVFERYEQVSVEHSFPSLSYRHPLKVIAQLWRLLRCRYDLAIDPMPRQRAGRFLLGWVRARDRLGYRWGVRWRDAMLTHVADASSAPRHFARAPVYLLREAYPAGARPADAAVAEVERPLDLRLTEAERERGTQRLAAALGTPAEAPIGMLGPCFAVFAHASGRKGFSSEWWRQLVDAVRRRVPGARLLEIVPADGRPRLGGVIPGIHTPELRLLAATLAATSLVVIPDGGVMHLAEAAGARLLGLFKTTDPTQYGPLRAGSEGLWALNANVEAVADRVVATSERDKRRE